MARFILGAPFKILTLLKYSFIFRFQSEAKPCEATLSPPIFTSCSALVTFCLQLRDEVEAKLRYEDREAVADRVNRATCSASCGASRVFASQRLQLQSRSEASVNDLL